jgi:hypothetical protein
VTIVIKFITDTSIYAITGYYYYSSLPIEVTVVMRFITAISTRGSVMVKALCYKPEGREFETR